ncbi:hypothetical protein BDW74DRAFT_172841 [Aspergillus multicolor]|uniref:Zn(II)2Cys6 transcription factor n=1 Tax=Aspergillus multicolor TaxID=41759 RepID=UPI003CCD947C
MDHKSITIKYEKSPAKAGIAERVRQSISVHAWWQLHKEGRAASRDPCRRLRHPQPTYQPAPTLPAIPGNSTFINVCKSRGMVPGQLKRKRARVACEPCRNRKRKCDGAAPCDTCKDWGYECHYAAERSSTRPRATATASPIGPPLNNTAAVSRNGHPVSDASCSRTDSYRKSIDPQRVAGRLAANSSIVFVRKLSLKVDPANAPRINLFSWNVGARQLSSGLVPAATGLPIVDLVPLGNMTQLAQVYFDKVDPCYGFIDKDAFLGRLESRWRSGAIVKMFDSVLAGVAALGLLFSERAASAMELQLVETAKSILEGYDGYTAPSADLITGWVLRTVYMRMTAAPYSTWLASCTLMHLIEAAGFHHEYIDSAICDPDIRRRLVGVAQHQHLWPSYDIGLSRLLLKGELSPNLEPRPGDYTAELIGLLPISARLDPETQGDSSSDHALYQSLIQTLDRTHTQPPSVLAQTNLVLCILRRLNLLNIHLEPSLPDRVLALFKRALLSVRSMLTECCPWQHIANVPFHIITILLEMDTCASLALLGEAMEALNAVALIYNTATMREASTTARFLVFLYQNRRARDAQLLSSVLETNSQPLSRPSGISAGLNQTSLPRRSPNLDDMPLLEGLVADMSGLQELDLDFDQFLNSDIFRSAPGAD